MNAKRLTIAALCLATLVGLWIIGVAMFDQLACEGQTVNNNELPTEPQQIFGDRVVSQSFVAPRNGLNRIDLFLLTYGRKNSGEVTLRLLALPDQVNNPLEGTELYRTTFNAATVSDQTWRTFLFPPLANSAGQTYAISLQSPNSTDGNAITVGGIERNPYRAGTAYLGATPIPADMAFRSCYQMTAIKKLQVLAEQITRNRPTVWGNISFYGFILLSYGIVLLAFFWKLVKWVWDSLGPTNSQ